MPVLEIAAADVEDRAWAARLMASSEPWLTLGRTLEGCRRVCGNPEYPMYEARIASDPIGFALVNRRGVVGSPYLATLAVDPAHRGRGVGTLLVAHVEDVCRAEAAHLFLCVSSFNPRALALYRRLGYTQVGELPDYFIHGASELLMHKRLG
jgi:ribosomal protein S18 acetylase RimI-like enzyme